MLQRRSGVLALCLTGSLLLSGTGLAKPKWAGGAESEDAAGSSGAGPVLSFSADSTEHAYGDRVLLSWASEGTRFCQASGDWSGKFDTSGAYRTEPIDGPRSFTLKCLSQGGGVESTVHVAIAGDEPAVGAPPVETVTTEPPPPPTLALNASPTEIAAGGSMTLSWSSTDAESCQAAGGWSGTLSGSGVQASGSITASTSFSLTCTGAGGSASASVDVTVVPAPSVTLASALSTVPAGGSTTLTWSSQDAYACQASGGWSGSRSASGSEVIGPIAASTTFVLTCTGTGGNTVQMVSVGALGEVSISWVPPSENVDGTPLTDLASYRIYYGSMSRSYTDSIDIQDPTATSHAFAVASGDYYVTMTALDQNGNESAYANEIVRSVP